MVKAKDKFLLLNLFKIKDLWAQVIVTPEDKRIKVFNRGISKKLKGESPSGGHLDPTSIEGLKQK